MSVIDLQEESVWVNEAWRRTFGEPPPGRLDPLGRVHPDDQPRVRRAWQRLTQGNVESGEIEFRYRTPAGEYASVLTSARKTNVEGRPLLCIIARDITERTKAESALRASEERYRRLTEHAYDLIAETDAEGRFLYVSPRFREITGVEPDDLVGRPAFELIHPEDRARVGEMFRRVVDDGKSNHPLFRSRHRDGTWRWIESTGKTFQTDSGETRAVIVSRDVTERVQSKEALRIANDRLHTILSNAPVFVCALDRDGIVTLCEGSILQVAGIKPDDAVGRSISDLFQEEPRIREILSNALMGNEIEDLVGYRDRVLEIRTRPIRTEKGELDGVITIATDVTERARAESAQKRLESQVQQSQKLESLGLLAGGIAHDFNNLLTSILGHADLILADTRAKSPPFSNAERIRDASLRAVDLTNQMLAYAGQGTVEIRPIDLSQLVDNMVHLMRVSISKKATLNCELSDRLPVIEGDSGHISQVVLNLITNASEALGEKPGSITVRTGTIAVDHAYLSETFLHEDLAEGPYVFLEVSDTGSGMDEGTRSKIFDPFFSTKFTGRGLGLAVLLGIVRAHRGAIRVDSRTGEGTTFRVIFPPTEEALPVQPDAAPTPNSWEGSGTVLVVDDEADVRDVVGAMAPRFGLTVVTARNGREAVELFRSGSRNIVAVLLDMTMPRCSST
jgi:PAS domain S-box-containing protein